ncbi:multicopper oxidase domain-containing protein [Bacillus luteolus]|uniref:Copper-containing nitrite reductase n=1 Tax=Litchfieldia luteola TaxID=682179 RepID=A0ABR9QIN5_9BACI|nr:multicopper oxidase domain-containing protein [Cytobacillus luteolus]MBE4908358.1 multicopper oxidase domain-containing protein [Cytobacillus luteolus]MBP1943146.1 nitrite reductase (NO-forming) [Cytobacillus luteolus]
MNSRFKMVFILALSSMVILAGCNSSATDESSKKDGVVEAATSTNEVEVIAPHKDLNQEPIPVKIERIGENEVNVEMTSQITDIEISPDYNYKAWTFNGEAPGPVVVVKEGDMINFTLKNMDPAIPHSMDFHAVHAAPSKGFANVEPDETGTFRYPANKPGVFMYHCGTAPVLSHIANGMHGTIIVMPKDGYPNDAEIDREFVLIQNEWYKYNDINDFMNGEPSQVVFSAKALKEGDRNTNGDTFSLKNEPLLAKVGDRIRIYVNNVGPNEVSSFHVVGTVFDDVYIDGNPYNHMQGLQTVMLPASGGAVVEFTVTEVGNYPIVTHQFNHAQKGAVAMLKVTEDGKDDGKAVGGH